MIEATCTYRNGALHPCGPYNAELLDKAKPGIEYTVRITRSRSVPQHRLYWAWLTRVSEAVGWHSVEGLHEAIKHAFGLLDSFLGLDGKIHLRVGSTAFHKMDGDEFKRFFDAAIQVIDEKFSGTGSAIMGEMGMAE